MKLIAPSILSADFSKLGEEIRAVEIAPIGEEEERPAGWIKQRRLHIVDQRRARKGVRIPKRRPAVPAHGEKRAELECVILAQRQAARRVGTIEDQAEKERHGRKNDRLAVGLFAIQVHDESASGAPARGRVSINDHSSFSFNR